MQEIKGKAKDSFIYLYGGYTYHVDKRMKGTYGCSTRRMSGCRGMAVLEEDGTVNVSSLHDHAPTDVAARVSALKQEMYQLCERTDEPIKKIFDDVCQRDPEAAAQLNYPSLKTMLHRKRLAYKPPIPNTLRMLSLELNKHSEYEEMYKTFVTSDDGSSALLLSSNELLKALNECTELFVDGTFSIVPRRPRMMQLYSIHTRYVNTGIATMFVLCESRSEALYQKIWEKIVELAPALKTNVKFIMGDYEKATISVLHKIFPEANIHGCWFHFNQCILRKWRKLGLNNCSKTLISMAMSVPLIPYTRFEDAFSILQVEADKVCCDFPNVLQFMSYMRGTWLQISKKVSVYKCPARTNSIVESFHNTALKRFGQHTSLWIFINNMKKLIITQGIDFGRAKNNLSVRRVRSKFNDERDKIIIQRQEDLDRNRITLSEFLRSFSRFNTNQSYVIDSIIEATLDEDIGEIKICADLLSETSVECSEENQAANDVSNTNTSGNLHQRRLQYSRRKNSSLKSTDENENEMTNPEESARAPQLCEILCDSEHESVLEVPNDDYGYWLNNESNISDEETAFFPVQRLPSTSIRENKGKEDKSMCIICLTNEATKIIIPCGHMCLCADCAGTIEEEKDNNNAQNCPLCKVEIANIIRVIPT